MSKSIVRAERTKQVLEVIAMLARDPNMQLTVACDTAGITVDQYSRTLHRKRVVKTGKGKGNEEWSIVGHYNRHSMDNLLKTMLHIESMRHGHTFSLEEYIALWARLYEKFIEDVRKIVPELVSTDESGYKSVAYDKIPVLLVEAIKEQQIIINSQANINRELQAKVRFLESENRAMFERLEIVERLITENIQGK